MCDIIATPVGLEFGLNRATLSPNEVPPLFRSCWCLLLLSAPLSYSAAPPMVHHALQCGFNLACTNQISCDLWLFRLQRAARFQSHLGWQSGRGQNVFKDTERFCFVGPSALVWKARRTTEATRRSEGTKASPCWTKAGMRMNEDLPPFVAS